MTQETANMYSPEEAAENFSGPGEAIAAVEKYGRGNIHATFLVKLKGPAEAFILQRVNTGVFREPELIMHNLRILNDHVRQGRPELLNILAPEWQMMRIVPGKDGRDFFVDPEGGFWRAFAFIRGAHPLEEIAGPGDAGEAGRALGIFHRLTADLDPGLLHDTLPGFHDMAAYLSRYDEVLSVGRGTDPSGTGEFCREFIAARRNWAPVLENGRKLGKLHVRVIHGDPKINNILVDDSTGRAVSIIDLDTVKPGLLLYDIGDCLRSSCNLMGEDTENPTTVRFDLERCRAVLRAYMAVAGAYLSPGDFDLLYDALRLIPLELGLRFYTDYLEGNPYFRIEYPVHNLDRAMVQFRLVESIEEQEESIRTLIEKYRLAGE